ncbi:MarR family winged helix-turn-helix transcriptional regulator [Ferrimonas balearica]|uniref:MarR family winged helix-turn-helix transcriptional regulator n=1 Tax=Ferrimonas balearica TaxID=44012 RepID=UPI001C994A6C|nr:MarR family winged helix-turn-helix transcriptional regulator [Ferrimonas balearica]MBY5921014.1 MarR family winged helix-turn-helix transcriptional regulator [Ferrimonas balearica]MBY5996301.1 MarR family winged helix-turn-helix transcriptional regulator [Ferrimonas balearica]
MNPSLTTIPELDNSLSFVMSLAQKQYRAISNQRLAQAFDITLEMVGAIKVLDHLGCIPQQQLADVLKRDRSVTKRLVDNCIKRGLIEASRSDTNRKARMLSLTEEGQRVNRESAPLLKQSSEEFFTQLSGEERQQLMGMLQKLVREDIRTE